MIFEFVIPDYDVIFDTMSWASEGCSLNRGAMVLKHQIPIRFLSAGL